MKQHGEHIIKIFACRGSMALAQKIAEKLGVELGKSEVLDFSDGEFQPAYLESVRGATVFIVQSTYPPTDNMFELLLMIDAARRASAYKVVAVIPYFGWARQDRKDRPRVSIGAKLVANLLHAAGCDRVMTCDLHADQIQGFFDFPVDHIYARPLFIDYIRSLNLPNLSICSPDAGGAKRANSYCKRLDAPMIICSKNRIRANVVGSMTAIGEVKDRDVVIVDDMADTAGTLCKCAELLKSLGARSVRALATHAVLSGTAYENISSSQLEEFIVTDTIPLRNAPGTDVSKIKVLTIAGRFADIIYKVYNNIPINESYS